MKNMKKILTIFIILLGFVFLFGCEDFTSGNKTNPNEGTTYSITYVMDGKIANLAPASYVAGKITLLGKVDEGYIGWYTNPSYTGATYNSISADDYGDKTFYAKADGTTPINPGEVTLENALKKMSSYTYLLTYEDDEEYNYSDTFMYYNGILKYISVGEMDTYEDYFFFDSTKNMMCVYLDEGDEYGVYYENDEFFGLATLYLCDLDLKSINVDNYTKAGNVYTAKQDKLLTESQNVFYQYQIETPTKFEIEVNEFGISKVTLEYIEEYDEESYGAKYSATFSNIGTTTVTLPEVKDDPIPSETDLGKAVLEMTSYDYHVDYIDEDPTYSQSYDFSFANDVIRYEYEYDEDIYVDFYYYNTETHLWTYLSDCGYGDYEEIDEENEYFIYYADYIVEFDLMYINENNYTQSGNKFTCIESKLAEEVGNVFSAYEFKEIKSFEIEVGTKGLSKITLCFEDEYEEETYQASYEVTFSNVGNVDFDLPETTISGENAIANVYEYSDGASVTVEGIICGTIGNNFYLTDNYSGVYIYYGNSSHDYEVGDYICLTGVKDTYKGLVELKNISAVGYVDNKKHEVSPCALEDFKDVEDYLAMPVTFEDIKLIELPSSFDATSKSDLSFDVESSNGETILLFISKHISSTIKEDWYELLSECSDGDYINIENAVISCFNDYQIAFTEQTVINLGYKPGDPIVLKSIEVSNDELIVNEGTSLEDALKDLVVTFKYNDHSTVTATKEEYDLDGLNYDKDFPGVYDVVISASNIECYITIFVKATPKEVFKADNTNIIKLDDLVSTYDITYGIKSVGEGKALVIPVDFTDYPAPTNMKENLNKAFFGTSLDTGWESLASYYNKSSYGKLSITGLVTDVYHTGKTSTYYTNLYNNATDDDLIEYEIIKGALEYFDSSIDYSLFDADNNGFIDAIYIIYSCPVDYESDDSFWWAYTYEYFTEDYEYYDEVEADFYFFAGYEFIFEELQSEAKIDINSETFIHETGHILGLTDYYDIYEGEGPEGGLGGGDMMDYNVGDHNAFSKAILGWVEPYIVTGLDCTLTISSFGSTGDCIIIAKNWSGTYFDEYYIIDYYTPDGLNALEAGEVGLFSIDGVRILHVDATLYPDPEEVYSIWYVYEYDNSSTDHKLVDLVQADKSNSINKDNTYSYDTDLFGEGDTFDWATWYNGFDCGFSLTVKSIKEGKAEIVIDFK